MFKRILVALDHSQADQPLLSRVAELARLTGGELVLLHVSTGWAAHWQDNLNLADSPEMREDREYVQKVGNEISGQGVKVTLRHATGDAADAVLNTARAEKCDLIAMTSHGHRGVADVIYGSTIEKVRHQSEIPLFLVKAEPARPLSAKT